MIYFQELPIIPIRKTFAFNTNFNPREWGEKGKEEEKKKRKEED